MQRACGAKRTSTSLWQGIVQHRIGPHRNWYERGKTGAGRLELADQDLQGAVVSSLEAARLERCDLSGASLSLLDELELQDCVLDEINATRSSWRRVAICSGVISNGRPGLGQRLGRVLSAPAACATRCLTARPSWIATSDQRISLARISFSRWLDVLAHVSWAATSGARTWTVCASITRCSTTAGSTT